MQRLDAVRPAKSKKQKSVNAFLFLNYFNQIYALQLFSLKAIFLWTELANVGLWTQVGKLIWVNMMKVF